MPAEELEAWFRDGTLASAASYENKQKTWPSATRVDAEAEYRVYLGCKRARLASKLPQKSGRARLNPKYKRFSLTAETLVADGQNPA